MRLIFTLFCLLVTFFTAPAQKLTGVWRGYFMQRDYDPMSRSFVEDQYNYEIQINNELAKDAIEGVTYSFFTTVFYGKAAMKGVYTRSTKNLVIKETKMIDLKIGDNSVPCLMTCYLDYSNVGGKEVLSGTYTSVNTSKKQDCGSGTVYVEKVPETKFKKEDFLLALEQKNKGNNKISALTKPQNTPLQKTVTVQKPLVNKSVPATKTNTPPPAKAVTKPPVVVYAKPKAVAQKNQSAAKPVAATNKPLLNKPAPPTLLVDKAEPKKSEQQTIQATDKVLLQQPREMPVQKSTPPPPPELLQRMDQLVRTIEVNEPDILIEFYDNGEIDNDTISVYHNNTRVVKEGRLTYRPITVKIHCTEPNEQHEVVVVADNLGDIAPNTALMVVTVGKKRYEVFLSTNEQKNARVVFQYKPKG